MDTNKFAEEVFRAFTPKPPEPDLVPDTVMVTRILWCRSDVSGDIISVIELPNVIVSLVQYGIDHGSSIQDGLTWFWKMQELQPDWGPTSTLPLFLSSESDTPVPSYAAPLQPQDRFKIEFAEENPNNEDTEYSTFSETYELTALNGFVFLEKGTS